MSEKRMRCRFARAGQQCERVAMDHWTTCPPRHYTSGMNRSTFERVAVLTKGKGK